MAKLPPSIEKTKTRNLIQVFGQRSTGTNFIEWTLVHNFTGFKYENKYKICDVPYTPDYGFLEALKHSYPTLKWSQYAIVTWKYGRTMRKYLDKARALDPERVIIVTHRWAYFNYEEFIDLIVRKFNVSRNILLKKPKNRLNRGGANCIETDTPFVFKET